MRLKLRARAAVPHTVLSRTLAPGHLWVAAVLLTLSCSRGTPSEQAKAPVPAPAQPVPATPPPISQLLASFVVQRCPDSAKMSSKAAESAMRQLLTPCDRVPGGMAHFSATLVPGGRIELASPAGEPADGVVPTCVLKYRLKHAVTLSEPCTFEVRLEERMVAR